jgi:hypothetical protein
LLREEIRRLKVEARHREEAVAVSLSAMLSPSHASSNRNLGPKPLIPQSLYLESEF